MKILIMMISIFAVSISQQGTLYLGFEGEPELSINGTTQTLDSGGVVLGYNRPVHMSEDKTKVLAFGTSIYLCDQQVDEHNNWGYLSFYALPMYNFTPKVATWMSLGYSRVLGAPATTTDSGLTYGLGLHYRLNDVYGMGLGYVVNNNEGSSENDTGGYDALDYENTRLTVYLSKAF